MRGWNFSFLVFPYVLNGFLMMFFKFSMCSSKGVLNSTSLYLIPIAQTSHLLIYIKGGTPSSHRNGYFEEPPKFFFFGDGPIKMTHAQPQKNKKKPLKATHLMKRRAQVNRRGE